MDRERRARPTRYTCLACGERHPEHTSARCKLGIPEAVYTCPDCGRAYSTRLAATGIAPHAFPCLDCGGPATSGGYRPGPRPPAEFAWVRPDRLELAALSPPLRRWARGGGLILRAIGS